MAKQDKSKAKTISAPASRQLDYSKSKLVDKSEAEILAEGYEKKTAPDGSVHYVKQSEAQKPKVPKPVTSNPKPKVPVVGKTNFTKPRPKPVEPQSEYNQDIVRIEQKKTPEKKALIPDISVRGEEKRTTISPDVYAIDYPDTQGGGGMSKATRKYFNQNAAKGQVGAELDTGGLSDITGHYDASGNYTPKFVAGATQISPQNTPQGMGSISLMSNPVNQDALLTQQANSKNPLDITGNTKSEMAIQGLNAPSIDKSSQVIGTGFKPIETTDDILKKRQLTDTTVTSPKFNKGGKVPKIPKGYQNGGNVVTEQEQMRKQQNEQNIRGGANMLGKGLGAYGSTYQANQIGQGTQSDDVRSQALGSIGQMGAIGGAISGLASIGDKVGAPVKQRAEETDEYGNLKDPTKAKQMGLVGGLLSPSKALAYRADSGNWTDVTGKGYTDYLESNAKKKIAEEKKLKDQEKFDQSLQSAMNERGFKDGGMIKGKGDGKSDSIKAMIKPNSFIVPTEKVEEAKEVVKKVVKVPSIGKAKLKQANGAPVKVSNGEMIISPKEVEKIEDKLGEKVWEKLAPNAEKQEDMMEGEMEEMEMKYGGLTPEKAAIMLHDKSFTTDKQRRYFGWVAGGRKKDGGMVDCYKDGGKTKSPKVPSYKFTPKEIQDNETFAPVPTNNINGVSDFSEVIDPRFKEKAPLSKEGAEIYNATLEKAAKEEIKKPKYEPTIWDKLKNSNALEYGAALGQIGLGLKGLKENKRPEYSIDSVYGDTLASAQNRAKKATEQAQYGYNPQEQFMIDQQNKNALNSAMASARNYSGGSASNAYNLSRAAINDSFQRGLKSLLAGNDYKMQKQQYANQQQAYADQLALKKLDLQRQIFDDSMNKFMQNQTAYGNLANTGASNLIGAKRYQDEKNFQNKNNI